MEQLDPVTSPLPGGGEARSAGHLQSFSTDDPAKACLAQGPALPVYQLVASPTTYVVQTTTPGFCTAGTWEFTAPTASGGSGTGSSTGGGSGGSTGGGGGSTGQPPGSTSTMPEPVTLPPLTGSSAP
jgi:hypothetical protein